MVQDYLLVHFWGMPKAGNPTPKQCEFAREFGFTINTETFAVGSAVVGDIMDHLNQEAIEQQNLIPGATVRFRRNPEKGEFVISSVTPDGTVYFKGGNGKKAWARSLERVAK